MRTSFLIAIILLFISSCCFSQTFIDTLIQHLQKEHRLSTIKKEMAGLQNIVPNNELGEMPYDFGATTLHCYLVTAEAGYIIQAHAQADSIINLELTELTKEKSTLHYRSLFKFLDTALATQYVAKHNAHYTSNKKPGDLFYSVDQQFGFSCDMGKTLTPSGKYCRELIDKKDTVQLQALATSLDPGERAYAVAGLYILEKSGMLLNERAKELINLNQNSAAATDTCAGCLGGFISLNELISDEKLKLYDQGHKQQK